MRVLLAAAPHRDTFGYAMPPPGLLRLSGALEAAGYAVELDDLAHALQAGALPASDELCAAAAERVLSRGAPDVLGLSCMGATLPAALAIAKRVRAQAPQARIVLGGPGCGGIDSQLLARFVWVDFVVRGEGEVTLPSLLASLGAGGDGAGVAGVTRRGPDGAVVREADRAPLADLDALPAPAWHLVPSFAEYAELARGGEGLVPVDSGRGCAYDCSFCSIGRYWSRRSRTLPVARLVEEVLAVCDLAGGRRAYLCHDLFGADRAHALALCVELERRGAPVPWEARARADHLDTGLVQAMARAGCYRVLVGVETADPGLRNAHGKRMDVDLDVAAVVVRLAEAGIGAIVSLMLGLPGEDEESLRATLDLALACASRAGANVSLHLPNPQPGCALGDAHATTSRPVASLAPDMARGAGTTAPERELIAAYPELFSTFALLTGERSEAELRDLAALAEGLPPALHRAPRTVALLAHKRGGDTLDLWRVSGGDPLALARASADPEVRDALAWEEAIARAASREHEDEGELLELATDAPAVLAGRAPSPGPHRLLVAPGGRGVRTVRVVAADPPRGAPT